MSDITFDVVKCESCRTSMLTYYTADNLIAYVCPSCIDWTASEEKRNSSPLFVNWPSLVVCFCWYVWMMIP